MKARISPSGKPKPVQHMHGNIQYLFDFLADPFVHLLLLKSSMAMHSYTTTLELQFWQ